MNIQDFYAKISEEERRDDRFLHLTPNEPYLSETTREFMSSRLADRYYMGGGSDGLVDLEPFTALGFPSIEALVSAAEDATKEMLGAAVVNLNCLSGIHAMMCSIIATTRPGDTIMTVHHDHGGHFATKGVVDNIGRRHIFTPAYNFKTFTFDAEAIAKAFKKAKAKVFYMDVSYYLNPHNLREIRDALGDDAVIIYDASHTIGLIMGQQFQAPLQDGANVVCANTHKTLPGPQKGMIAFRDNDFGEKANNIINSSMFSSSHTASLIALSTAILEMKEFGKEYAQQIISNSNALGEALYRKGHKLRKANTGRYSENHQVHLFTEHLGDYRMLYKQFTSNNITLAFDHQDIFKQGIFIRLGTQEVTRRGMKEQEMRIIAGFIDRCIKGELLGEEVVSFNSKYKEAHYSFDIAKINT